MRRWRHTKVGEIEGGWKSMRCLLHTCNLRLRWGMGLVVCDGYGERAVSEALLQ